MEKHGCGCENCLNRLCAHRVPVFSSLNHEEILKVSSLIIKKKYSRGELIIMEGDTLDSLVIISSGNAKAFRDTQEGIEGFRHAFSESPLIFNKNLIISIGSRHEEAYGNTMNYFKNRSREDYPTAIVCFNDQQALAVMTALKELNIRIPEDISIIGNDDIIYAKIYPVPLTTIRAPQREIGYKAAEILIRNIESSTALPNEKIVLGTDLVIRESSRVLN